MDAEAALFGFSLCAGAVSAAATLMADACVDTKEPARNAAWRTQIAEAPVAEPGAELLRVPRRQLGSGSVRGQPSLQGAARMHRGAEA